MAENTHTVEHALTALAARCDGAVTEDGQGFNGRDTGFGHSLAAQLASGRTLSPKQLGAAHKMLRTYKVQLAGLGIDYDAITIDAPAQRAAAEAIAIHLTAAGRIGIRSPFRIKDEVKALPTARWDAEAKQWHVLTSEAAVEQLKRLADANGLAFAHDDACGVLLDQARAAHRARVAAKSLSDTQLPELPGKTPAWHHQKRAFLFARERRGSMLAMDMGTGKTRTAIGLAEHWQVDLTIVLCPASVTLVWPDQLRQHAGRDWVCAAGGKGDSIAKRIRSFADAIRLGRATRRPVLLAVNYEASYQGGMGEFLIEALDTAKTAGQATLLILDESHRIKAAGGVQSTYAAKLAKRAERILGLTGTPAPHSPLDLYAQGRAIDPSIYGTSNAKFKTRYGLWGGYQGHEFLGMRPDTLPEFTEKLASFSYQCKAEDVLDLPASRHATIPVRLSPRAAKAYNALADELVAEIDQGVVTAANVLVKILRHMQITSGVLPVENPDGDVEVVEIDTAKRDALVDLLADIPADEKVVVFGRFTHDLANVRYACEKTGRAYGELSGRDKRGIAEGGRFAPGVNVLGAQIASGGVGIDLTAAHHQVYLSTGHNLGQYEQSLARTLRPGQTDDVTYHHIVAAGTIDVAIQQALADRKSVVEAVLRNARTFTQPNQED